MRAGAGSRRRVCNAAAGVSVRPRTHLARRARDSMVPLTRVFRSAVGPQQHAPATWRKRTMRTGFAMLAGVAALSLVVGVGTASAATKYKHYRHHAANSHSMQAPAAPQAAFTYEDNHNPAKKYPTRNIADNAVKSGTLMQNGNNPAKRYVAQRPIDNASREGTLSQSGNNPAKRYKSTTTGAASR